MELFEAKKLIENYNPSDKLEMQDRIMFLQCIEAFKEKVFDRDNLAAHFSSSAIVFNKTHDKILMAYHNIFKAYSWLGGHNDGDFDFLNVALKEVKEESSLKNVDVISKEIISLECLYVNAHIKRGKQVPYHLHLNVSYVFEADENEDIKIKEDENSSIKWILINELEEYVDEPVMIPVYKKIINKAKKLYNWEEK